MFFHKFALSYHSIFLPIPEYFLGFKIHFDYHEFSLSYSTLKKIQPNYAIAIALAPFSDLFTFSSTYYTVIQNARSCLLIRKWSSYRHKKFFWFQVIAFIMNFDNSIQKSFFFSKRPFLGSMTILAISTVSIQ